MHGCTNVGLLKPERPCPSALVHSCIPAFVHSCISRAYLPVRKLVIATTNRDKIREILGLLDGLPFDLRTLADFPALAAPEETGDTFAANARAKALYYAAAIGELTVAEDSGLAVDALGGAPGVESARYGGAAASYPQKFARLYEALRAVGGEASPARFVCAVAWYGG
jgi:XTP/dITP diphosphohydrolase